MPPSGAPHLWDEGWGGGGGREARLVPGEPWVRPERKGPDEARADSTCRRGEGRALPPPPASGPARNPALSLLPCLLARALALTAGLGVERGPRVGGTLTSLGCRDSGAPGGGGGAGSSALRSPCGREPGCSRVFRGTQPQTRTPREGRGGAGAGAARGAGAAGVARMGAPGIQGPAGSPSRAVWGPRASRHPAPPPARAPSPLPISSTVRFPYLRLPPPGRGQVPSPSAWLRSPWNFSEERLLRKETKGTQTQRGREGASAAGTSPGPCSRPLGPPLRDPITIRMVQGYSPRPHPHDDPTSSRSPKDCCLQPHPHSEGKSQTLVLAFKALCHLLWSASQLCLLPSAPITPVLLCFAPAVPRA